MNRSAFGGVTGIGGLEVKRWALILLLAALCPVGAIKTNWYEIDYDKSQISFLAKSRVVNASGIFRKWNFKGKIGGNLHVIGELNIDCNSIDTDNDRRDNHLKNADFFDCDKNPQHVFRVRSVKGDNSNPGKAVRFEIEGELTMHGVTLPVAFTMTREGDEARMTLSGSTMLDRDKFGISYNSMLNPIEKTVRLDFRLVLVRRGDK